MRALETWIKCVSIAATTLFVAARADWPYAVIAAFLAWGGVSALANLLAFRRATSRTPTAAASLRRTHAETHIPGALSSERGVIDPQAQAGRGETTSSTDYPVCLESNAWTDHDDTLKHWDHQRLDTSNSVWK